MGPGGDVLHQYTYIIFAKIDIDTMYRVLTIGLSCSTVAKCTLGVRSSAHGGFGVRSEKTEKS